MGPSSRQHPLPHSTSNQPGQVPGKARPRPPCPCPPCHGHGTTTGPPAQTHATAALHHHQRGCIHATDPTRGKGGPGQPATQSTSLTPPPGWNITSVKPALADPMHVGQWMQPTLTISSPKPLGVGTWEAFPQVRHASGALSFPMPVGWPNTPQVPCPCIGQCSILENTWPLSGPGPHPPFSCMPGHGPCMLACTSRARVPLCLPPHAWLQGP